MDAVASDAGLCSGDGPIAVTLDLADRLKDCRLVPGTRLVANYNPTDLEAEYAILGQETGGVMPAQPEEAEQTDVVYDEEAPDVGRKVRAKHREPAQAVEEVVADDAVDDAQDPAVEVPLRRAPKAVHSEVGVAAPEVNVKKLVDESAGATPYTVMLALIAVVGGGAGWKFYQNYAKQKHEQAMKALEIEQSKADRNADAHQACAAKSAARSAQVVSLASKLSQVESRVSAIPESAPDLGFSPKDFEKMDKRIKAVEKKLQAPKPSA